MRESVLRIESIELEESSSCRRMQQDQLVGELDLHRRGMTAMSGARLMIAEQIEAARRMMQPEPVLSN